MIKIATKEVFKCRSCIPFFLNKLYKETIFRQYNIEAKCHFDRTFRRKFISQSVIQHISITGSFPSLPDQSAIEINAPTSDSVLYGPVAGNDVQQQINSIQQVSLITSKPALMFLTKSYTNQLQRL